MSQPKSKIGQAAWFDLPVVHLSDAMSFYEGLLGWKYRQMDDSVVPEYVMIEAEGLLIGGLRQVKEAAPSINAPVLYFTVERLAPKLIRAKELGAELMGETVELGKERGCYQWIRDREGHVIGLWAEK